MRMTCIGNLATLAALVLSLAPCALRAEQQKGQAVEFGPGGKLVYETDEAGNRVPDFSHAGYGGGGATIPDAPAVVRVGPRDGDDTDRIQAAINYVSSLPLDDDGLRGAVVLGPGRFEVSGQLTISTSGVVLRGAGSGEDGTVVHATGTGRRTLIRVHGEGRPGRQENAVPVDGFVPVGSRSIPLDSTGSFAAGDRVLVTRPSTANWIELLGMETSPGRTPYRWKPETLDVTWERTVASVEPGSLILDAPVTTALDPEFGGATVVKVTWPERIRDCGIEGLRLISDYDPERPKDENHSWMAIEMDAVEDAWIRDVTGVHFVSSVVDLGLDTRTVTVMDCKSLQPVSEDGGYRRNTFHTAGQQTLFLRCHSELGRSDFTAGYLAAGPNVFLYCDTRQSTDLSGSIGSWASGLLFDNVHVDGGSLGFDNLEIRYDGVGWAAASSVLWQSTASHIIVRSPPGATNRGIGVWGEFYGGGLWYKVNEFVNPQSLYVAQLAERLGKTALGALEPFAAPAEDNDAPELGDLVEYWRGYLPPEPALAPGMRIENGWIADDQGVMTGTQSPTSWWRGNLLPARTGDHPPSLTRFLPGRHGPGATDDLEQLARWMVARNDIQLRHHWGLWYDRRRQDHQMIRRMTGDVWPPFYEQPFDRSGIGAAWDGLSRYDLTRFNPWYFQRLQDFAGAAHRHGRVLVNEMFFQHNIIESGAHWVDYPWRPVNNIQGTDFPEPPPFRGDTIHIGNLFYDMEQDWLRETHTRYIRHCLDNLAGQPNVIHTTGDEYTGPLSYVQYWLDTISQWVAEGNPDPVIALSTTKDVQDSILADPVRSRLVDVVEFKYWFNTDNGLYAPKGGEELAPRQHLRKWKGGDSSEKNVANMVRDYRLAYPGKAVTVSQIRGMEGWTMLAAGASLAPVPPLLDPAIRQAIPGMDPIPATGPDADSYWIIGDNRHFLVCALPEVEAILETPGSASFEFRQVDGATGRLMGQSKTTSPGKSTRLPALSGRLAIYWVTRTDSDSQ